MGNALKNHTTRARLQEVCTYVEIC